MRAPPADLGRFLDPFAPEVRALALALRARVLDIVPSAHETVWDAYNAVSLVCSPTSRWQDGICHIAVYSRHVNLGFNDGATLPDPDGIPSGTGARIRHVTLRPGDDVSAPWIRAYVEAALAQRGLDRDMGDGGTTIRATTGGTRRPRPEGR